MLSATLGPITNNSSSSGYQSYTFAKRDIVITTPSAGASSSPRCPPQRCPTTKALVRDEKRSGMRCGLTHSRERARRARRTVHRERQDEERDLRASVQATSEKIVVVPEPARFVPPQVHLRHER